MKLKQSKIIQIFVKRKVWIRQVLVASIAASFAWFLGDALVENGGLVAAIICSLSIRISMYKSVREGFGQIIGTAIGAAFIEEFIKDNIPWCHLDIAGVADSASHLPYCPANGASGTMIRTLTNFLTHA